MYSDYKISVNLCNIIIHTIANVIVATIRYGANAISFFKHICILIESNHEFFIIQICFSSI